MSKSPRPKPGLVEKPAKDKASQAAASALHVKTRVVKFDDFETSFLPEPPAANRRKNGPGSSDGNHR